jgi:hypothetical protein
MVQMDALPFRHRNPQHWVRDDERPDAAVAANLNPDGRHAVCLIGKAAPALARRRDHLVRVRQAAGAVHHAIGVDPSHPNVAGRHRRGLTRIRFDRQRHVQTTDRGDT